MKDSQTPQVCVADVLCRSLSQVHHAGISRWWLRDAVVVENMQERFATSLGSLLAPAFVSTVTLLPPFPSLFPTTHTHRHAYTQVLPVPAFTPSSFFFFVQLCSLLLLVPFSPSLYLSSLFHKYLFYFSYPLLTSADTCVCIRGQHAAKKKTEGSAASDSIQGGKKNHDYSCCVRSAVLRCICAGIRTRPSFLFSHFFSFIVCVCSAHPPRGACVCE